MAIARGVFVSVVTCGLAACWLTSSFDGLTYLAATDGAADTSQADGGGDGGLSDGADASDAPTPCVTAATYKESVLAEQPVAYYRLDDVPPSTTAKDSVGRNDGTYSTGVTLGQPGALKNDPDTAASFDGEGGIVTVGPVFPFLGLSSFSVEAWIRPTGSDTEYRGILSNESQDNTIAREGYLMYVQTAQGRIGFERWGNLMSDPTVDDGGLAVGAFSHVVGTFDGPSLTVTLYLNGTVVSTVSSHVSIAQGDTFVIGALNSGMQVSNFLGTLDEVAVYDHALSASCVRAHYRLGSGQ